eukprot:TRINITY_DN103193_c0_g1_i1.p1 TRINITY_DN103193_c0_g1~~TRINITY_DN103193_c0_g1_i1.p1  ORF type:complete len:577 (-),score=179.37 TRINITY_DN103193_c0_g1_i1:143-1873(-)
MFNVLEYFCTNSIIPCSTKTCCTSARKEPFTESDAKCNALAGDVPFVPSNHNPLEAEAWLKDKKSQNGQEGEAVDFVDEHDGHVSGILDDQFGSHCEDDKDDHGQMPLTDMGTPAGAFQDTASEALGAGVLEDDRWLGVWVCGRNGYSPPWEYEIRREGNGDLVYEACASSEASPTLRGVAWSSCKLRVKGSTSLWGHIEDDDGEPKPVALRLEKGSVENKDAIHICLNMEPSVRSKRKHKADAQLLSLRAEKLDAVLSPAPKVKAKSQQRCERSELPPQKAEASPTAAKNGYKQSDFADLSQASKADKQSRREQMRSKESEISSVAATSTEDGQEDDEERKQRKAAEKARKRERAIEKARAEAKERFQALARQKQEAEVKQAAVAAAATALNFLPALSEADEDEHDDAFSADPASRRSSLDGSTKELMELAMATNMSEKELEAKKQLLEQQRRRRRESQSEVSKRKSIWEARQWASLQAQRNAEMNKKHKQHAEGEEGRCIITFMGMEAGYSTNIDEVASPQQHKENHGIGNHGHEHGNHNDKDHHNQAKRNSVPGGSRSPAVHRGNRRSRGSKG